MRLGRRQLLRAPQSACWPFGGVPAWDPPSSYFALGSPCSQPSQAASSPSTGSLGERQVFLKALTRSQPFGPIRSSTSALPALPEGRRRDPPMGAQTYLHLQLVESPEIGQDIHLTLLARNLEFASKELKLSLSAQSVLHNGHPLVPFWQDTVYLSFSPKEGKAGGGCGWSGGPGAALLSPRLPTLFPQKSASPGTSPTGSTAGTSRRTSRSGWWP